jgi:DNA-binding HxlR family transcriptional regulator
MAEPPAPHSVDHPSGPPGAPARVPEPRRPLTEALDLLGRRWVLRMVWELHRSPTGFRDLQRRCDGMSSSVLSSRLQELRAAGIIATERDGTNELTALGSNLVAALAPLRDWAREWAEGAEAKGG